MAAALIALCRQCVVFEAPGFPRLGRAVSCELLGLWGFYSFALDQRV